MGQKHRAADRGARCNPARQARRIGVEPSLRGDIAEALRDLSPDTLPLVERLRLVKSPSEVAMIRRAAHYADWAVAQLLGASYRGAAVADCVLRQLIVCRPHTHPVARPEPKAEAAASQTIDFECPQCGEAR